MKKPIQSRITESERLEIVRRCESGQTCAKVGREMQLPRNVVLAVWQAALWQASRNRIEQTLQSRGLTRAAVVNFFKRGEA